jgi:hypothetical protein
MFCKETADSADKGLDELLVGAYSPLFMAFGSKILAVFTIIAVAVTLARAKDSPTATSTVR